MLTASRARSRIILATFLTFLLVILGIRSENDNCIVNHYEKGDPYRRDYRIQCTGDVNVSNFLWEHRHLQHNSTFMERLCCLEIINTNIEEINEETLQFHGFKFESIRIENAPNLRSVHARSLIQLKDQLRFFRAINTSLPQYNDFGSDALRDDNPFDDFKQLFQVYIGQQSRCPFNETLLFPCECMFGELPNWAPSYYGISIENPIANTTILYCDDENMTGDDMKKFFESVSSSDHEPKHFDTLIIGQTANIPRFTEIPSNVFSNVSITSVLIFGAEYLKSIHPNAFVSERNDISASSIQVFQMEGANSIGASPIEVDNVFSALSSLRNVRYLEIYDCGIPYIPPFAFVPENRKHSQLNNLCVINLHYNRMKNGKKSVGRFAFSGAPNLNVLRLTRNSIDEFDSFAFAFNKTSNRTLAIEIGANPFNTTYGLKPHAFSGSRRPVQITVRVHVIPTDLVDRPLIDSMPEDVFQPFFAERPNNYFVVEFFNVDVWCDCRSQWMFDRNGNLKTIVQNGFRLKKNMKQLRQPLSFECKSESSFECLPNCLTFPAAGLIHCGGSKPFDIKSTFRELARSLNVKAFRNLLFSTKEIQELPMDAFAGFQFTSISLEGCWNLTSIHPDAFKASTNTLKTFTAKSTNLAYYPSFADFPELENIQFDDYKTFRINSSNFDFTHAKRSPREIHIFMKDGTIDQETFTKLNNETSIDLNIGEWNDTASNVNGFSKCKPSNIQLDRITFKNFLEANANNKIKINCFLECSCDLQWMRKSWNDDAAQSISSRIALWSPRYYDSFRWPLMQVRDKFYCAPKGTVPYVPNSQLKHDEYFTENCSG